MNDTVNIPAIPKRVRHVESGRLHTVLTIEPGKDPIITTWSDPHPHPTEKAAGESWMGPHSQFVWQFKVP